MYDNLKKGDNGMKAAAKSGGAGKDPMVPRLEKHPIKSGMWKQKKMKGDC